MNRLYTPLAFIIGMLFMHSLTGEYARYGLDIDNEVSDCEVETGKECDYTVSPIHTISLPAPSSSASPSFDLGALSLHVELNPNQDTKASVSYSFSFLLA